MGHHPFFKDLYGKQCRDENTPVLESVLSYA